MHDANCKSLQSLRMAVEKRKQHHDAATLKALVGELKECWRRKQEQPEMRSVRHRMSMLLLYCEASWLTNDEQFLAVSLFRLAQLWNRSPLLPGKALLFGRLAALLIQKKY